MENIKRRQHHSREYRHKAVELLLTGKPVSDLARDLGISPSALVKWKNQYLLDMAAEPGDVAQLGPMELEQKYKQLVKDHRRLQLDQEILKKALGILSATLPPNMS
jgi:transposase-like protein